MKHLKIYLLLLPFISSCHSQSDKFVDLGKISTKFNVSVFFENKLKKTEEVMNTDVKKLDKKKVLSLLNNPLFAKDTLGFYDTEGRFPTDLYLEATNDWMTRKKKPTEIFGYGYKTVAYNEDLDTLAILNTVVFPKMNMVEDRNGNLMYLKTGKTSKKQSDYIKIKDYLEKNCKKIEVEDGDQNTNYWEDENFFYALAKNEKTEEDILSFDSQGEGDKNTEKVKVIELSLAMYTKSFIKRMEELKIYSGGNLFWKKSPM